MKAPTKQLTPEVRRRVAEACTGHRCMVRNDGFIELLGGEYAGDLWQPDELTRLWKLLAMKASQLVAEMSEVKQWDVMRRRAKLEKCNRFIATNDTTALEALLAELMGEKDE